MTLAPISLREAVAARKALNAQGKREVDMRAIIRTALAQRELVDRATKATASARRSGASRNSAGDDEGWGSLRGVDSSKPVPFVEDTD